MPFSVKIKIMMVTPLCNCPAAILCSFSAIRSTNSYHFYERKEEFSRYKELCTMSAFQTSKTTTGWKHKVSTFSKLGSYSVLTSSAPEEYSNQALPSHIGILRGQCKGILLEFSTIFLCLAAPCFEESTFHD